MACFPILEIEMASEVKPESVHEAVAASPDGAVTTEIKSPTASTEKSSDKETRLTFEQPEVSPLCRDWGWRRT